MNGVWQNPYETDTVFAVSPSVNAYNSYGTYRVNVILPSTLWLSNSAGSVSSLAADFADGQGFRNLATNQIYALSYSSGSTKTWTFKATLTNGFVLQSRTDIQLDSSSILAYNTKRQNTSGVANTTVSKKLKFKPFGFQAPALPMTADLAFYGQKASGFMTILYANADQKLRKPLIVAEGFDPGDVIAPEQAYGLTNISSFLQALTDPQASFNLANILDYNNTYDVIYVDWGHGADFIERNAMLLEKIINYVNTNKITTTPNVVIGQSMGGLVARYALKDMENHSLNHL